MDENKRANDLIVITGRLAEVLERENDALKNHRNREVHDLLEEKATLGRIYETRMQVLADEPEMLDGIDADVRERLKTLGDKIDTLLEENARRLKTAIDANRRVVDLIADAVKAATPSSGTYGADGSTDMPSHRADAKGATFSLDQTL